MMVESVEDGEVITLDERMILASVDHTLLRTTATWAEIRQVCDDGVSFGCASVCIPPSYVRQASEYLAGKLPVCTVIGFPNGYSTTAVKIFETRDALANGASEIDVVVNLGWVKDGRWAEILAELRAVKAACGEHTLKVIVETCQLTQEEKVQLCQLVTDSGADFIKTSTGFAGGGATREDVALLRSCVGKEVQVKAAGGISTLEDGADFLALGASRLGTSGIVALCKKQGVSNHVEKSE